MADSLPWEIPLGVRIPLTVLGPESCGWGLFMSGSQPGSGDPLSGF